MGLKARYIQCNGTRAWLRIYWGLPFDEERNLQPMSCPVGPKGHGASYHNAQTFLTETDVIDAKKLGGEPSDYPFERWPTKCEWCGAAPDYSSPELKRQVFRKRRYNTASGDPEPGDLYYVSWGRGENAGCPFHDNCDGQHLFAILPNGEDWDIDGRASNCDRPHDRTHRCWVRHGEPPQITVDKRGLTCHAGAGSIALGSYHGFLHNGVFT
jgi:hypothetical protein